MELIVKPDPSAVALAAAELFTRWATTSDREKITVALAGGSTPAVLYELLSARPFRDHLPWQKIHWFLGDERCVPPDHADSNFRMIREALFDPANVPTHLRHPAVCTDMNPGDAARSYETEIREVFGTADGRHPTFDIMILGMGTDVHTASLFPETMALSEKDRSVVANRVPKLNAWRITVTPPVIDAARNVMLLATGTEKAEALQTLLHGERDENLYPAQLLRRRNPERTVVIADKHAAIG